LAIEQPSPSCQGVARPAAVSGFAGTASEQLSEAAAWAALWWVLMAAPVPSTGTVATSPSCAAARVPPANEFAGGTVAVALALGLAPADAVPVAVAVAVAVAVPDAVAVGLADVVGWCRWNAESATLTDPLWIATTTPTPTAAATGTATTAAMRARRLPCERLRAVER
jgi:hypothetical protein